MSTCIIQLDNFHGQYYPGNTISGKVICSFSNTINTRGIQVSLLGKEHIEWKQTGSYYDKDLEKVIAKAVPISEDNNVLEVITTVAGKCNYPPGRHEYPFSFVLPKYLPASYIGKYGWIKYMLKAVVTIPFGFDYQDNRELRVVAPVDLNETPGLQLEPIIRTSEKNVWWLFRSCGLITMKIHMEKTAFTVGEVVKVKLEVTNMSTESMEKVEVKMRMVTQATGVFTKMETKTEYAEYAAVSDTGVGAHGERIYLFDLMIPSKIVLLNFNACKLFKYWNELIVTGVMKGIITNMEVTIPIQLGNIPVRTRDHLQNASYQSNSAPLYAEYAPYSPKGIPSSPYSTDASPVPTAPRERPPSYSEIDRNLSCPSNSSTHIYPVIPQDIQYSGTDSSLPKSSVPPKAPIIESITPPAPTEEESDDGFVLL